MTTVKEAINTAKNSAEVCRETLTAAVLRSFQLTPKRLRSRLKWDPLPIQGREALCFLAVKVAQLNPGPLAESLGYEVSAIQAAATRAETRARRDPEFKARLLSCFDAC